MLSLSDRFVPRITVLLVVVTVLAAGSTATRPASAQSEPPGELITFGQQIAVLLQRGDDEALADLFVEVERECPLYSPSETILPICEGVPDGDTVTGLLVGQIGSEAGVVAREDFLRGMNTLRDEFEGSEFRLYSVSTDGRYVGALACPECWAIAISTPAEAGVADTEVPVVFDSRSSKPRPACSSTRRHSAATSTARGLMAEPPTTDGRLLPSTPRMAVHRLRRRHPSTARLRPTRRRPEPVRAAPA